MGRVKIENRRVSDVRHNQDFSARQILSERLSHIKTNDCPNPKFCFANSTQATIGKTRYIFKTKILTLVITNLCLFKTFKFNKIKLRLTHIDTNKNIFIY